MEFLNVVVLFKTNRMATILLVPGSKSKNIFSGCKIDMTHMVDLGFLLITFFIFTTSMMQPTKTELSMPKQGGEQEVNERLLLTALVDKDRAYVYEGVFGNSTGKFVVTGYNTQTGLGHYIRQKQYQLEATGEKDQLMIAIKPLPSASYQDVINALDEMLINSVQRYGIMNLTEEEKQLAIRKTQ